MVLETEDFMTKIFIFQKTCELICIMNICSLSLYRTNAQNRMSPRRKMLRKLISPPSVKGFTPFGPEVSSGKEAVVMFFEEYESIKLCDYDMYNHNQASVIMSVSRPTFTRIYSAARQKVAMAFVEARQLVVEGGKVYFDSEWYICNNCSCSFNNPHRDVEIKQCGLCGSDDFDRYEQGNEEAQNNQLICICPECATEVVAESGRGCAKNRCPECNAWLKRKNLN